MVYISPEGRPTLHSYHQCHSEWSCSLQVPYSSMRCHPQRCLKVKVPQPCPILCDPMDCTVYGILQARILEWVAVPFSRDLPKPGVKPRSPALQAYSLPSEPPGKPKDGYSHLIKEQTKVPSGPKAHGSQYLRPVCLISKHSGSSLTTCPRCS